MRYDIPLPDLLDANANYIGALHVVSASIIETLSPLSTASITLPADETIPIRYFVKMYTPNGKAGIFRSRVPEEAYQSDTCTIELEHALSEVGDYVITEDLSVNDAANVVAAQIMSYYRGSLWTLGTVEATENIKATLDNANVLNALGDLMAALPAYMMTFDFDTMPWRINIVARPTQVSAEGRLSRNVESAVIERDDTELCTRVYMDKLPNGHLDADTINTYGVVERYITGDDATTEAEALTIAQKYLDLRKNPTITITISAQDLHQITGDPLDKIQLGTMYRLSLNDDSTVYEKLVTQLEWGDVYGRPAEVTVTLADEATNLSSVMAGMQLQISKVTNATYLLSNAISGDRERLDIMSRDINVQGEQVRVNAANIDLIASEEERAIIAGHDMTFYREAGLAISANGVSIRALETETNNISGRVDRAESELSVQSEAIRAKVSKGDVATELSVEAGNVSITGGNLIVDGYATVQALNATNADIQNLVTGSTVAQTLAATALVGSRLDVGGSFVYSGQSVSWQSINWSVNSLATRQFLGVESMSLGHYHVMSESGGVITLGAPTTSASAATFDIAATTFYQDAVAAAYDRGVQDGAGTITVDSVVIAKSGSAQWDGTTLTQRVYAAAMHEGGGGDEDVLKSTTQTLTIDATKPYSAGVSSVVINQALEKVSQTIAPNNKTIYAQVKATATNGATKSSGITIDATEAYEAGEDSVTLSQSRATSTATIYNDSSGTVSVRLYIKLSNGQSYTPYVDVSYRTID